MVSIKKKVVPRIEKKWKEISSWGQVTWKWYFGKGKVRVSMLQKCEINQDCNLKNVYFSLFFTSHMSQCPVSNLMKMTCANWVISLHWKKESYRGRYFSQFWHNLFLFFPSFVLVLFSFFVPAFSTYTCMLCLNCVLVPQRSNGCSPSPQKDSFLHSGQHHQ